MTQDAIERTGMEVVKKGSTEGVRDAGNFSVVS